MDMKYVLFLTSLVLGAVKAETDTDGLQEDEYRMETKTIGNEEEIVILDKDDRVVAEVDMFEDQGYQIDKPVGEENLCLLRTIVGTDEESNYTDTCYVRRAVLHEEGIELGTELGLNMSLVFDHCGNRSLYILVQQDCDRIDNIETGMSRQKRSWPVGNYCCYYKEYISVTCTQWENTSRCCRRCFWTCCRRCKKCVRTSTRHVKEKICHYE